MKESTKKAQAAYNRKCKLYPLRVNKETEQDIIKWLECGGYATRIKELIRQDLKNNPLE